MTLPSGAGAQYIDLDQRQPKSNRSSNAVLQDAHPDRLSACFRSPGAARLLQRMIDKPRFEERLAGLLIDHYGLDGADAGTGLSDVSQADLVVRGLDRKGFDALTLKCGTVLWSKAFIREVRRDAVVALTERFGEAAYKAALEHRDLGFDRPEAENLDILEQAVTADGRGCVGAWMQTQPNAVVQRLRLKWPDDASVPTSIDETLAERGILIVRRLATDPAMAADPP